MGDECKKPHAIFVGYPLQGHVIPAVHLAIKLASRGFTITFVNTESIHEQTAKSQPDDDGDIFAGARRSGLDIRYTTVSDGLPLAFDRSLNHDQFMAALLHVLSAHVDETVARIVKSSDPPVTCLIADTFFVWPSKIAKKYGLKYVSFWTEAALVFTLYYHVDLLRKHGHFGCLRAREEPIEYLPGVPSIDPKDMTSYLQDCNGWNVCHQIIFTSFDDAKGADFVLCNTVQELEPQTIQALQARVPLYAIGPIFPTGFARSIVPTSLWPEADCNEWLDNKPPASVLYVSFGSYAHVTRDDLVEIAMGLSLSKINFVWVLRPDIVSSDDVDPLPVGFREEVGDRAMIIPWCCQVQVLAHRSIGGFLSHCGWNSVLESIWCEVPLLCSPLLTDQFTNRKLVADDWKIGINLCDKKPISRVEISEKINRLMSEKSGNEYKKRIGELKKTLEKATAKGGSSENNFDQFMKELILKRKRKGGAESGIEKDEGLPIIE
ncbi:Trans-zeatin O-beta-D-glucosyltransferase [Bertholletia excelsa]